MKTINLPPYAPTLIESTRSLGYSLETAVADILDNSISAEASNLEIDYDTVPAAHIAILDNGFGMNGDELNNAMQYGSKNPNEARGDKDLGRFGLGLKTASLSQCRKLTVVSKQGQNIEARCWDLDHVIQAQDWSLQILEEDELQGLPKFKDLMKLDHGTLVVWQKLDRLKEGEVRFDLQLGKMMEDVREHLSLVFHRYLAGEKGLKKISVSMNGFPIAPKDPFLQGKSLQTMPDEKIKLRDQTVVVRPFLLPHISKMTRDEIASLGGKEGLAKNQGFYIYRNKRLIVWGTWFRIEKMADVSQLARIQVDIPNTLDSLWTLDIKKSAAVPPAEIKRNLEKLVPKLTGMSKNTWAFRGKKQLDAKKDPVWQRLKTRDGGYVYTINRDNQLIRFLSKRFEKDSAELETALRLIEDNIPYHQMYLDMSDNGTIERKSSEEDLKKMEDTLRELIRNIDDRNLAEGLLMAVANKDPYSSHPELIERVKKEII